MTLAQTPEAARSQSNTEALVMALRRLSVALTATVVAVVVVSASIVAISVQGRDEANNRADAAIAETRRLQDSERCKTEVLRDVSVVLVRQAQALNAVVISLAQGQRADLTKMVEVQEQLARLAEADLLACGGPSGIPPAPGTSTTQTPAVGESLAG